MAQNDRSSRRALMDLPHEILNAITGELRIHDMARLAATNETIKAYIEPQLYCKMYTNIGTPQDTAGLVGLLKRRPEVVPMIKALVLDEYHPRYTRQLLAIAMPNLWCLLIQHEGQPVNVVSEEEKRTMNRNLVYQPSLKNYVFWIESTNRVPYTLSKEDAALFKQPAIDRLRLSNVDFLALEGVEETYLTHEGLENIKIEGSNYSPDTLKRLFFPSNALKDVDIHHWTEPPFSPALYLPILSSAAETLTILRLEWRYTRLNHAAGYDGLDLTAFTALRLLRIQPGVLFGPGGEGVTSYTTPSHPNLPNLIRSRLPPGLKVLLLESITMPPPAPGLKQLLFPMDIELIACMIEQKAQVAPKLKFIFLYYLEEMTEPEELYELADKHDMRLCGLYKSEISPISILRHLILNVGLICGDLGTMLSDGAAKIWRPMSMFRVMAN
ncbi:MAG: hypothetical protein Q9224_004701 [Gallowayella concinna]